MKPSVPLWLLLLAVTGCHTPAEPALPPLPGLPPGTAAAAPRINGFIGTPQAGTGAELSYGRTEAPRQPAGSAATATGGDISLDFADTDIREVVAQVLGNILHVNYTIDPSVHGTVTLRTVSPLTRAQLVPTLQTLLSQNGATLVQTAGLYRVLPSTAVPGTVAGGPATAGAAVVPLRYAQAEDLAKVLQPFVGSSGRIAAEPASNALLVSGEPIARDSLVDLVRAFDIDALAGQSYVLLPVNSGGARDFATQMQDALRSAGSSALAGQVRVVPMDRVDAVLVVSSRPAYIDDARRIYELVEHARRSTVRSWHVYYLQNSRSNDIANVLQRAFTPNDVTAQPSPERQPGATAPGMATQAMGGGGAASASGPSALGGATTTGGFGGGGGGLGGVGGAGGLGGASAVAQPAQQGQATQVSANPLLGGLGPGGGGEVDVDAMRIVPNPQNNAVLVYATREEEDTVEAMLRKIDILPLQVRIDATVAEVTLNDALQYGTQYYFKQGGLNGMLSSTFDTGIPGFLLAGSNSGAQIAISALQSVTNVHVLSSPQLLVLDNQPARLEVGDLVPYLTSTSQSTLVTGAPVINSINYQQTGVILDVTPRVNGGGLVTLDISQEVSDVDPTVTTAGISSPTFADRTVQTRVVVQDGQTVGLAGLISDSSSHGSSGFPFVKDIPLLGLLLGQQNNSRTRTELLVLVTPHVIHDQRDARNLTEDLREHLSDAAQIPYELQRLKPSGSADPEAPLLRRTGLQQ